MWRDKEREGETRNVKEGQGTWRRDKERGGGTKNVKEEQGT